ncbi:hypothetical protein [Helicobacter mesocricetorum]|uniref:hypothetical protein n=1 Tax=Helicobacter mesocricetorum TaxID=87012 RepID=UPI000CF13592|nr:hypothetical protein [Helicobacter mesocricetorum]
MEISVQGLMLSLLQKSGLSFFSIFDIRSKQAFLSAHLHDSLHAKDKQEIIKFYKTSIYPAGGGGKTSFNCLF